MVSIFKLLSFIVFLGLVFQGDAANCPLESISIVQSKTGNWAHGMPEWKVSISHKCACALSQLNLNCDGFQTNEAVDPSILSVSGAICLVKNGGPISSSQSFFFLVVFLGLVSQGDAARCHIKVFQKKTGNWAHGMPEWKVVVTHNCLCAVSQVKLNCNDFQTYLAVDPSILTVSDGDAGCSPFEPQELIIVQSKTGKLTRGKPEWKVSITNECRCSQSQVKLKCDGFQTNEAVDPSILTISDGICLLNKGTPISPSQNVQFFYAWDSQFPFIIASSQVQCPSLNYRSSIIS
ncbi:TPD1 protein-like 1, partial [Mucuna pruriens]